MRDGQKYFLLYIGKLVVVKVVGSFDIAHSIMMNKVLWIEDCE